MAMNRLLLLPESRNRRRRAAYWAKAKRRIRYAAGYLNKLMAGMDGRTERDRCIVARDVEDLLEDARLYVRKGSRTKRRSS